MAEQKESAKINDIQTINYEEEYNRLKAEYEKLSIKFDKLVGLYNMVLSQYLEQ